MVDGLETREHAALGQALEMIFTNVLKEKKELQIDFSKTFYDVFLPAWWSSDQTCGRTE